MEYVKELFLGLGYSSWDQIFIKLIIWISTSALVVWLGWYLFSRLARKSKLRRELILRLALLRSYALFMVLFAVYLFFLVRVNGLHAFHWNRPVFYLALGPQLLTFLLSILLFGLSYTRYNRQIK